MSAKKTSESPLSHTPKTVGECLDGRKTIERRINNALTSATNDASLVFWKEGQCVLNSAESQVQAVLDRYQALCELNEFVNAVSALKMTDVVMPSFCENVSPVHFTLGQLRDSKTFVLPLLNDMILHFTEQANIIKQESSAYDKKIEMALQAELEKNKKEHEERKRKAQEFGEEVPLDEILVTTQETARNRAKTLMSVLVDPVGVRDLVTRMKSFATMLETYADIKIDAVNSTDIEKEITKFKTMRNEAYEAITNGQQIAHPEEYDGQHLVSLAELGIMMQTLRDDIASAIPYLQIVSYKKGQTRDVEHPKVLNIKSNLEDVFHNISSLICFRQAFREGMSLNFPTLHPLSNVPLSVDGLVRLGYVKEKEAAPKRQSHKREKAPKGRGIMGGRGGIRGRIAPNSMLRQQDFDSDMDDYTVSKSSEACTLADCLSKLFTMLDSTETKLASAKKEHERALQESISAKQDARTKNAQALKPGELDDIAKSIRTTEAKTWTVADNIDKTMARVSRLLQQVEELQSSVRKSANSTIKVLVPRTRDMTWAMELDSLASW
jgi:hypothetical protein